MRKLLSFRRVDVEVDFCTQAPSVHLCAVPGNVSVQGGPGSCVGCRSLIVWPLQLSSARQALMTALTGQSLQPRQAGLSKLSLAHNQVSPRLGANPAGSHFPWWEDNQEDGVHVLCIDVIHQKSVQHWGWDHQRCPVVNPNMGPSFSIFITATPGPLTIPEQNWSVFDFLTQLSSPVMVLGVLIITVSHGLNLTDFAMRVLERNFWLRSRMLLSAQSHLVIGALPNLNSHWHGLPLSWLVLGTGLVPVRKISSLPAFLC